MTEKWKQVRPVLSHSLIVRSPPYLSYSPLPSLSPSFYLSFSYFLLPSPQNGLYTKGFAHQMSDVPVMITCSWYDPYIDTSMELYQALAPPTPLKTNNVATAASAPTASAAAAAGGGKGGGGGGLSALLSHAADPPPPPSQTPSPLLDSPSCPPANTVNSAQNDKANDTKDLSNNPIKARSGKIRMILGPWKHGDHAGG